jgi:hypothetical protein
LVKKILSKWFKSSNDILSFPKIVYYYFSLVVIPGRLLFFTWFKLLEKGFNPTAVAIGSVSFDQLLDFLTKLGLLLQDWPF